eukprot:5857954-Pleurochrysis_carterae.AAC.2
MSICTLGAKLTFFQAVGQCIASGKDGELGERVRERTGERAALIRESGRNQTSEERRPSSEAKIR